MIGHMLIFPDSICLDAYNGIPPQGWEPCGGADEDMAGVIWEDSGGNVLVGVYVSHKNDPCTWYLAPKGVRLPFPF